MVEPFAEFSEKGGVLLECGAIGIGDRREAMSHGGQRVGGRHRRQSTFPMSSGPRTRGEYSEATRERYTRIASGTSAPMTT